MGGEDSWVETSLSREGGARPRNMGGEDSWVETSLSREGGARPRNRGRRGFLGRDESF